MVMPDTETFGEFRSRYKGMNPDFCRRVWRKRREAGHRAIPPQESEPVSELAAVQFEKWEAARIKKLRLQMEAGGAKAIIADIALKHGFSMDEILGQRRSKKLIAARHEAIVEVARQRPAWSLTQIGRVFNRDHTTILHVINKAARSEPASTDRGAR